MRILSWPAEGLAKEKQTTKRIRHNQILPRIWLAFFQQDGFHGMTLVDYSVRPNLMSIRHEAAGHRDFVLKLAGKVQWNPTANPTMIGGTWNNRQYEFSIDWRQCPVVM